MTKYNGPADISQAERLSDVSRLMTTQPKVVRQMTRRPITRGIIPASVPPQPTIRAINDHVRFGTGVCVVYGSDFTMRISRARFFGGAKQGRVITYNQANGTLKRTFAPWEVIPADAVIELI